ncbi:hypothetical protein TNCV_3438631 [Trichonephila clavipes]|nr:hypothetical protein TNCV_3438631 [Trichonephila clavipes]
MSLPSFRVNQEATSQQSSVSTEKRLRTPTAARTRLDVVVIVPRAPRRDRTVDYCLDEKKVTNTNRRVDAVGCRCHRSPCNKTRTDSRVVARRKKLTNTHRRAAAVGCRCHRSACTKTRPDSRVVPRRKKDTNTHRHVSAVGCRCHRSACTKTRTDSRVVPGRGKSDEHTPPSDCSRMSLSLFRVHQDATGQQSSASTEKVTNTHSRAAAVGCRCHRSACTKRRPGSRVLP